MRKLVSCAAINQIQQTKTKNSMKGQFSKLWLLTIAIILVLSTNTFSQPSERGEKTVKYVNGFKVVKGERPPINLDEVPESAYEQGRMLIKFSPNMNKFLESPITKANELEYIQTGNERFDKLNKKYKIAQYKQTIIDLYSVDDNSKGHKARHEAWGFDLWYELTMEKTSDIKNAVADFAALEEVEIAEPVYKKRRIEPVEIKPITTTKNSKLFPNDELYSLLWGLNNTGQDIRDIPGVEGIDINIKEAWEIEKGNPSVIVSVHDEGVQFDHPDLEANMWPNIGPDGTNTLAGDHGTHVAGTIAAVTNNEIGVSGIAGGDGSGNGIRIMSIDIFDGTMSTQAGFVYAADNGAAISQNSWGYTNPGVYSQAVHDAIDYFNMNGGGDAVTGGGIVFFAAGNDNNNGRWYPAYYSGTIAVASHDNKGIKSGFSNYGNWIDISAPGTNIASTASDNKYVWMSGTSMACPHVSGVAALVVSKYFGSISKPQLRNAILNGVEDIYKYNPSYNGSLGSGMTNANQTLHLASFPILETAEVETIYATEAIGGGIIMYEGAPLIAKGLVWGKNEDPTLEICAGFTNEGTGFDSFISTMTNLEPNTQYFVKAYVTNTFGTIYSSNIAFQTLSEITFEVVDENRNLIKDATVVLDGNPNVVDNSGQAVFYMPSNTYGYKVSADGYQSTGGTITVGSEENLVKLILLSVSSTDVSIVGETNVCINSEVIYHITDNSTTGSWEVEGGSIISNPNESSVIIGWSFSTEDWIIRYKVITEDDYTISYQKEITVDENKIIHSTDKPRIHKKGDIPILICTNPDLEYKWYKNGTLVEGETQQHFAPRNQPGSYQVQTTDHRQCPNTSSAMQVTAVMETGTIATYPNPSKGEFTIDFASKSMGSGSITVSNSHGKIVFQETFSKSEQQLSRRLNLTGLPKGIYIVRVYVDNDIPVNSKISIN